jgi:VWFA-related protein
MPIKLLTLTLLFAFTPLTFSQTNQAPSLTTRSTLHTSAHLVVLDVVVEDKDHNPVRGLKASDFQILESNVPQHARSFEEHFPPSVGDAARLPFIPKLLPGMFTNYVPVPQNSAINVILLDALNTPQMDQSYLHDQLLAFVRSQPAGFPTAIFGLSQGLYILQGFTSDPKVLEAAIQRKDIPQKSLLLENSLLGNGNTTLNEFVAANAGGGALGDQGISQALANMQGFDKYVGVERTESRASVTLDALNAIARYLSAIPGRKNLIWFSGAFPINPIPSATLPPATTSPTASLLSGSVDSASGFSDFAGNEGEFRETTNLLARSQVAVYPIDARGLFGFSGMDAATSGTQYATRSNPNAPSPGLLAGNDISDFVANTAAEHAVMNTMARDTGGEAFYNANSLAKFATQAMRKGSFYYTLTYTPANTKWNGNFRKIAVQIEGSKYTLNYRRGYYADDPDEPNNRHEAAALAPTHSRPVTAAMMRGAPNPTQILISARVHPATASTEEMLAPDNVLDQPDKLHSLGPLRRFVVECVADPNSIEVRQLPNGNRVFQAEFLTFVFDASGKRINRVSTRLEGDLTPENYALIQKRGLAVRQQISVPAKGETFMRIGVHDLLSDRVGTLEITTAQVASLPLVEPSTASR